MSTSRKHYPAILKLAPNRDLRRLALIHRGYVELLSFFGGTRSYLELESWGLLEKHEPVDWLDAYDGYRPTKKGLAYLHYDEPHHLILIRPSKVEVVRKMLMQHVEMQLEAAVANLVQEIALAKARGWEYDAEAGILPGTEAAVARLVRRGYMPLDAFNQQYKLSRDELVVAGVLRYHEHKDPERMASLTIGTKAKHCLMLSTRWQQVFVKPGMADALNDLVKINEHSAEDP